MSSIKIDEKTFQRHLATFYQNWKDNKELWNSADVAVVMYGKHDEERVYRKSSAIQLWLLGYELPETLFVATENKLYFITSARKVKILEQLKQTPCVVPLELITYPKTGGKEQLEKLLETIKEDGDKTIGILQRDKHEGSFAEEWDSVISDQKRVDITNGISSILAVKDAGEVKMIRRAATITSTVVKKILIPRIENVIENEVKIKHSELANEIENYILNPEKINPKLVKDVLDKCYSPVIQSGGEYDLNPTACSTDARLDFDTIIFSLGVRYRSYCSNVARTIFINPDKEQEAIFEFLISVQKACLEALKPGQELSSVYNAATELIAKEKPELSDKFVKNCGFGMGIEFREASLLISPKNKQQVKPGMVFNLSVGFENLTKNTKKEGKNNYAMLVSDSVVISEEGVAQIITNDTKWMSYSLDADDEDEPDEVVHVQPSSKVMKEIAESSGRRRERATAVDANKTLDEEKRREHQRKLAEKQQNDRIRKYSGEQAGDQSSEQKSTSSQAQLNSYPSAVDFPPETPLHKISVDSNNESVILPLYGTMVPFHVSTIKSVNKDNEYLRINFLYPGNKTNMTFMNEQSLKDAKNCSFIRELSFKIPDPNALSEHVLKIKQLSKQVRARETMVGLQRTIKKQEKLQVTPGGRVPRLTAVFPRPSTARKSVGTLEAHRNGLRFTAAKTKGPIDILYKNIRYAFFQPADPNESLVALHFHLWDAIMVGIKKTFDVQFCTEVTELSQNLSNSRSNRYMDSDGYEEERRERAMRKKLNESFHNFTKTVEELTSTLEFDIPYRELAFYGVPQKSLVLIQPTVNCLVQLIEPPFFVLSLQEIEICNLERVSFQLKQFDAIFVLVDFSKPVVRIDNIPVEYLETLKKWLDSCNINFYEMPGTLNWKRIMKTIREDPTGFFKQGGWETMLRDDSEEGEDELEPGDDEFEMDDFEDPDDDDDDSLEMDSGDDFSGDGSDDSEGGEEEEEEEEEAPDWDELEEKCRQEDERKNQKRKMKGDEEFSDEDADTPPRKKRPPTDRGEPSRKKAAPPASRRAPPPAQRPRSSAPPPKRPPPGRGVPPPRRK